MKRFFAFLTAVLSVLSFSICAYASNGEILVDDADLLSFEEELMLCSRIDELSAENNISIVIHTTNGTGYKSVAAYADDFYDNGDYLEDGLVFVISMAERDYFTSTAGILVDSLPEYQFDTLCAPVVPYLSSGEYYEAFSLYLEQLDSYLSNDEDISGGAYYGGEYEYDEFYDGYYYESENVYEQDRFPSSASPAGAGLLGKEIFMLVIAVIIAVIITSVLKSKMNTAVKKHDANDYVVAGSFNLKTRYDAFMGSSITKRPLPKNNNINGSRPGGGAGGVRRSSGGVRHGGGGGKF